MAEHTDPTLLRRVADCLDRDDPVPAQMAITEHDGTEGSYLERLVLTVKYIRNMEYYAEHRPQIAHAVALGFRVQALLAEEDLPFDDCLCDDCTHKCMRVGEKALPLLVAYVQRALAAAQEWHAEEQRLAQRQAQSREA